MYRSRIEETRARSTAAERLKHAMLSYHDFHAGSKPISDEHIVQLNSWQTERLRQTHHDLYQSPEYETGLRFLFSDLYAATDFSDRDRDLERIFPKMVKLLPNSVLETVAILVELNLLTQKLDLELAEILFHQLKVREINQENYCEAYRYSAAYEARLQQIELISLAGIKLDKYARSSTIDFALKISQGPAEMAGLGALHAFILRGFQAFHAMAGVQQLMNTVTEREKQILERIFAGVAAPFKLPGMSSV